ncbi:hypothetical protein [Nostoc sp. T09]|uniref:hypothetical protein n=1 Tax=Nostoc sp. T09 TaxID=1932621 RepID=UPI00211AD7B5|nr:hypothetical protein [Nostoc sp. T09]
MQRIVEDLPGVVQIRSSCRWWQQEGKAACMRCPQIGILKLFLSNSGKRQILLRLRKSGISMFHTY